MFANDNRNNLNVQLTIFNLARDYI